MAYGWTDFVDEQLRPMYADERATVEGNVLEALLRLNFISCGSTTLIRRAALEDLGGFDETLNAAEDWELYTRLAARYAFVAVPEVVGWYRRSPRSLSSHFWLMERNFLAASRNGLRGSTSERAFPRIVRKGAVLSLSAGASHPEQDHSPGTGWPCRVFAGLAAGLAAWHDPVGL